MTSFINASTSSGVVTTADTSGVLALQTASTTALTLDTSQNATFAGTVTSTGVGGITVNKSAAGGTASVVLANSPSGDGVGRVNFQTSSTVTNWSINTNTVVGGELNITPSTAGGGSTFTTPALTITSASNVGIGTSSPAYKLNVKGGNGLGVTSADGTTTTNLAYDGVYAQNGILYLLAPSGASIKFYSNNAYVGSFDSGGNLLVGTTGRRSNEKFALYANTQEGIRIENDTGGTRYPINFNLGATGVGSISTAVSSTSYNTSSDYRLKNNIQPMQNALEKIALLKPVTYKWNIDNSDGQGFIAHELQAIVPEAVAGEKDAVDENGNPKYQGIDTSFLVATLTAAIQELSAKNDALTARIVALEGK